MDMFEVQPLSQRDNRWNTVILGHSKDNTIGAAGCLLTCLTMAANGFGANEDPASLNEKMKKVGGFSEDNLFTAKLPEVVPLVKWHAGKKPPALEDIDAALANDMPVIVKVDASPAPNLQQHWILLVDKVDNDYLMVDPFALPAQNKPAHLSKSAYNFAGGADRIVLDTVFYTGKPQQIPKNRPSGPLVVFADASDGLILRKEARQAKDTVIDTMQQGIKMVCLEAPDIAFAKVGQKGAWLQVQRVTDNQIGFVMAEFVSVAQDPPAAVKTVRETLGLPPDAPVVHATGDGLDLRSTTDLAGDNILKHVPAGAQFAVLDPPEIIDLIVGVEGQWLSVKDGEGVQGFAPGWLLAKTD
jgi:hypothetical protein